jgi:cytochrome P450
MTIDLESVDLVGPEPVRDPHGTFAELRSLGPVQWLPRHRAWILLDYDLVRKGLQEPAFTTDTITPLYERLSPEERSKYKLAEELLRGWMIFNDPPVHTQLRKPVAAAFTPRGVSGLRAEIEKLTDELLDRIDAGGEQDFMSAIAFPLPAAVISVLLGVEQDRYEDMRNWSRCLGALIMGKLARPDVWERALQAAEEMQVYFSGLIDYYKGNPADCLITRMIDAIGPDSPISHSQLVGACGLLLFAGHETTTSLLSSGVYHVSRTEGAAKRVSSEAGVAETAVEELMRFDGPSKILVRRVREDCTWSGHEFRAGQPVYCAVMAANRDPSQFPDPGRFMIDRTPNRHVGFGFGLHFCLGAQLARLEAQVVLPRVFARFPNLRLGVDPSELSWHPTIVGRTLRNLPIILE